MHRAGCGALQAAARLPGVIRAEPARAVSARIRNGHLSRRVAIVGKPDDAVLSRVLDNDLPGPKPFTHHFVDHQAAVGKT